MKESMSFTEWCEHTHYETMKKVLHTANCICENPEGDYDKKSLSHDQIDELKDIYCILHTMHCMKDKRKA